MKVDRLFNRPQRIVAGVMSGTSVDGIDAVVASIDGSGRGIKVDVIAHFFEPYPPGIRKALLANSAVSPSSTEEISQLNAALPICFESAILGAVKSARLQIKEVDLVGCHGQTIHHVPELQRIGEIETRSTLQIGDPSILAARLGVPVVGDFRQADMALGGQGAPLAPYLDFVLFSREGEGRILLNLGGIANITYLPPSCDRADITAFDTGPANMVIDGLMERLFARPFDDGGKVALSSDPDPATVDWLMEDEYVRREPPKSTGRERYGAHFVNEICTRFAEKFGPEPGWTDTQRAVVVSSATDFTVRSVAAGIRSAKGGAAVERVIAAGGGTRNKAIMSGLSRTLAPSVVEPIDSYGIRSSEKEALCFAVLAHELMNGIATGLPSVTGAARSAMQGKICFPS